MAINTKEIKKRIGSVKNTKKITKAMEMIAAVKMRKAVSAAEQTRDYAALAHNILENIKSKKINHPLSRGISIQKYNTNFINELNLPKETGKYLIILITSNRGLCGSYNTKILKKASKFVDSSNQKIDILAIGSKAGLFAKRNNLELIGLYDSISDTPTYEELLPISSDIQNSLKKEFMIM